MFLKCFFKKLWKNSLVVPIEIKKSTQITLIALIVLLQNTHSFFRWRFYKNPCLSTKLLVNFDCSDIPRKYIIS